MWEGQEKVQEKKWYKAVQLWEMKQFSLFISKLHVLNSTDF